MVDGVRLQKVLSQAGIGSRREMETWIDSGWVTVNGKTAKLGQHVVETDKIKARGKVVPNPLKHELKTRVLLYHKPVGEISSKSDPKHKKTIFDNLPTIRQGRWIQVGRLDINTSGLMIFTNDGELANQLMHPKQAIEREYAVRVHGEVTNEMLKQLVKGVELDDGLAKFQSIALSGAGKGLNAWYHVVLTEGRNREVRRLFASLGVEVSRLIRVRYGSITMPKYLSRGKSMELTPEAVRKLVSSIGASRD